MKILLIEDDRALSNNLKKLLEKENFAVDQSFNKEDALFQASEFPYDCILLDINLPDGSGFDICSSLRNLKITTPIIMITARGEVGERIKGLKLGADDYLPKPFDSQELIARVNALIRRSKKSPLPIIEIDDLRIKPQSHKVWRKGKELKLTAKEFAVLELLAYHSDEVVTRTMLMDHVWGSDFETFSNVIDVYIRNLRKKIDSNTKNKLIHTIRGKGYILSIKK